MITSLGGFLEDLIRFVINTTNPGHKQLLASKLSFIDSMHTI